MSKYLIGDIHGCAQEFKLLLQHLDYNPSQDELYLAGDLVGRGSDPKLVLDLVQKYQGQAVMGNYDMQLIAVLLGARQAHPDDNLTELVNLSPAEKQYYLDWYQEAVPFARNQENFLLVHAGKLPSWTSEQTAQYAQELHEVFWNLPKSEQIELLRGTFLSALDKLGEDYTAERISFAEFATRRRAFEALVVLTTTRFLAVTVDRQGGRLLKSLPQTLCEQATELCLAATSLLLDPGRYPRVDLAPGKGIPELAVGNSQITLPWYSFNDLIATDEFFTDIVELCFHNGVDTMSLGWDNNLATAGFEKPVYFGHWSRLNGYELDPGYICTDTSCIYGDKLSAYLLPEQLVTDSESLLNLAKPIAQVSKL